MSGDVAEIGCHPRADCLSIPSFSLRSSIPGRSGCAETIHVPRCSAAGDVRADAGGSWSCSEQLRFPVGSSPARISELRRGILYLCSAVRLLSLRRFPPGPRLMIPIHPLRYALRPCSQPSMPTRPSVPALRSPRLAVVLTTAHRPYRPQPRGVEGAQPQEEGGVGQARGGAGEHGCVHRYAGVMLRNPQAPRSAGRFARWHVISAVSQTLRW